MSNSNQVATGSALISRRAASLGALTLGLIFAGHASAEKGHAHAANGGQVQSIGKFEGELVVKQGTVTLYLIDESEQKVDASKYSATAAVLAKGNETKIVELRSAGENKLAGRIDFQFDSKFRATVTLKSDSHDLGKARYNIDAK